MAKIRQEKRLSEAEVRALRTELDALPRGSVTRKVIKGVARFYLQWAEKGRTKSRYLSADEVEPMRKKVERRRELIKILRSYPQKPAGAAEPIVGCGISIKRGDELARWARTAAAWERRDKFPLIMKYLHSSQEARVCVVYGLRRTGKTTMLMQAVNALSPEEFNRAAYVKASVQATMRDIDAVLRGLERDGVRIVLIDEATLMDDFIDMAALFSDVYAAGGMKVVLSGTDSLGFWFALDEELYDRAFLVHTTVIPFAEFGRVLGIRDIDEYIRYGGLMKAGETAFDDSDARSDEASFRDDESTRRYIDTAIARNIQRSLRCFNHGRKFLALRDLYEAGELTNVVNRIVEDMNHEFLVSVLLRDFRSNDLHSAAQMLLKGKRGETRFDLLGSIDERRVTAVLMELLDVWNADERTVAVSEAHLANVREWLKALDLLRFVPVKFSDGSDMPPRAVFTQPGMRYSQAQGLVFALSKDRRLAACDPAVVSRVRDKVLEDVKGRMLEDIVLSETMRAYGREADPIMGTSVFKLAFPRGEFDMVVRRPATNECKLFEVKHAMVSDDRQARHLRDVEMLAEVERRFGKVSDRSVLYRGKPFRAKDGVCWRNVEEFLCAIKVPVDGRSAVCDAWEAMRIV